MVSGKISGDPLALTTVGLNMAAIQAGANVQAPSTLFASAENNLSDLGNTATALTNLGGLSSALAASTYLTQAAAVAGYQPLDSDLTALSLIGAAVAGDLIYGTGAGTWGKLAAGGALRGLRQNAAGTAPEWADFMPGIDVNGFAGANENQKIAAMFTAAPTQPYAYRSTTHFGIIRDTAPLNYQGTRASFVQQHRDIAAGGTNELIPGAVFSFVSTGDGDVTAGSDLSLSIWEGLVSAHRKTGDGSGQALTFIGELGVYGAGLYNEFGGICGTVTNTGSLHGTISLFEAIASDGLDTTTNFDTTMSGVISRMRRWNAGSRRVVNFISASEGDVAPESAFGFSPGGFATWLRGIDFRYATFTTGQAILLKNNDAIAAMNAAGSTAASLLFLDTADNTWLAAGGKSKSVFLSNSDFEKQFSMLATDNAVNYFEVSGAVAANALGPIFQAAGSDTNIPVSIASKGSGSVFLLSNAGTVHDFRGVSSGVNYFGETNAATTGTPLLFSAGADTNVGFALATKGTGVYTFFTNSASKQFEISHVASAVNWLAVAGSATGSSPIISVAGSDTDRSVTLRGKGTGGVVLQDGGTAAKFTVNTTGIGFFATAPVARGALAAPSGTITRTTYDTTTVTLPQLAERVYAIINDLRAYGLVS